MRGKKRLAHIHNSLLQDVLPPCSADCFKNKVLYKFALQVGIGILFLLANHYVWQDKLNGKTWISNWKKSDDRSESFAVITIFINCWAYL